MAELSKLKTTSGTPSAATTTLSQISTKLFGEIPAWKLGHMIPRALWYRLKVVKDKIWLEVDEQSIPKRDPVSRKLVRKQQNPVPWDMTNIRSNMMDKPLHILQDVIEIIYRTIVVINDKTK